MLKILNTPGMEKEIKQFPVVQHTADDAKAYWDTSREHHKASFTGTLWNI